MEIIWEVYDGYAGGSRPQTTYVSDEELAELETDEEREEYINQCVQDDYEQKIYWAIISRR